ncbi:RSC complex protein [Flammula alnicola]|nr:RSC complex protein [Flammula alnicola]
MPISPVHKTAIEEVITAILNVAAPRGKRQLAAMFMDLVDRSSWPEYYEIIPEPRCLKNIQSGVAKGRYKEPKDVYTDLSLVFWNALFYNEVNSQIAMDAETLKNVLETEWKKRTVLPIPRASPPPSSAQKVHGVVPEAPGNRVEMKEEPAATTPAPPTPAPPIPAALPAPAVPARTATPANQNRPAPIASTSTSNYAYAKPVAIRPKSAQRQATPDMDVDVVSPESDGLDEDAGAFQAERDPQSEEIVKQLEKGLPKWSGFGEEGWMNEVNPERYSDIVHAIKGYKDIIGNRLAVCLEVVPEESPITLNLSSTTPISLKQIETRARHKMYKSSKEFDLDMVRLFEKARRWHEPGTEAYGRTLLLQRLYQAITSPNPPAAPYISSTNFASLRAGPGNVKPVHGSDGEGVPNVTTHRVLTRDRTFVDEVNYKGWKIKLADWVHLSNPDDPSRPIIGQVFRCWVSDEIEKKGQPGITVSWYYRPEQTYHPANRQFWEGEVFKTSHFADHPVEDIIEKIACQFTARHIRGRPRPPFWYVGFPLYVCDSRYNDRDRVFVRIKNWNSCVPEEVRQSTEFMPIYPFERTVYPVRLPSPFLVKGAGKGAAKGPGGIVSAVSEQVDGSGDADGAKKRYRSEGPPKNPSSAGVAPPTSMPYQSQHTTYIQPHIAQRVSGPDRSVVAAAGGLAAIGGPAQVEKLSPETAKLFDRDPDTNEVLWFAAPPSNLPHAKGPRHSLAYLQFLAAKRKRESDQGAVDGMNLDGDAAGQPKRARMSVPPTVTETTIRVLKEMSVDGLITL